MGTLLAYILVRYEFPGESVLSAIVDLPLAIPTLVTGLSLCALYRPNSPIGGFLERWASRWSSRRSASCSRCWWSRSRS